MTAAATISLGLVAVVAGWVMLAGPQLSVAGVAGVEGVRGVAGIVGDVGDTGAVPSTAAAGTTAQAADGSAASPPVEVRVRVPSGSRRVPLVPVAADGDGVLALPEDARSGGWWALGASAGASRGTVLIAGHVDTRRGGLGAFAALHALPMGAEVEVTAANGRAYPYVIAARRTYPQQRLPADLFTRTGTHRLVLVTCTGAYDRTTGGYDSNLVLYATPLP